MSEKIEPALTAELWEAVRLSRDGALAMVVHSGGKYPASAIAILNDLLPDSDPRKITRRMVEIIRMHAENEDHAEAASIADALESYLPPL